MPYSKLNPIRWGPKTPPLNVQCTFEDYFTVDCRRVKFLKVNHLLTLPPWNAFCSALTLQKGNLQSLNCFGFAYFLSVSISFYPTSSFPPPSFPFSPHTYIYFAIPILCFYSFTPSPLPLSSSPIYIFLFPSSVSIPLPPLLLPSSPCPPHLYCAPFLLLFFPS